MISLEVDRFENGNFPEIREMLNILRCICLKNDKEKIDDTKKNKAKQDNDQKNRTRMTKKKQDNHNFRLFLGSIPMKN